MYALDLENLLQYDDSGTIPQFNVKALNTMHHGIVWGFCTRENASLDIRNLHAIPRCNTISAFIFECRMAYQESVAITISNLS